MKKYLSLFFFLQLTVLTSCTTDADDEWNAAEVCPESGRGTFVDERDGQTYKYTTIGNQVWMAQNLNYHVDYGDSCAYVDDDCVEKGRLYYKKNIFDVCPNGWHLPSNDEWEKVLNDLGGAKIAGYRLKSKEGWLGVDLETDGNGVDACGICILPTKASFVEYDGYEANLWGYFVDEKTKEKDLWVIVVRSDVDTVMSKAFYSNFKYSVRCVKD